MGIGGTVPAFLPGFRCLGAVSRAGALSLALVVAGCSTMQDVVGAHRTGYQDDGTYVLSEQDKKLGCRQLEEKSDSLITQLQALPVRAVQEIQNAPSNIAALFGRAFGGGGDGLKAVDEYDRSHAEAVALNAELAKKGCVSTDIDAHIGEANEQMAFIKR